MSFVRSILFIFIIIAVEGLDGLETCDFAVTECMTRGAQKIYKALVTGVKDLIEPIDPLYLGTVDAELDSFNYHVTNATMNGLRNCTIDQFKTDKINFNFEYGLLCPKVIFTYNFDAKGQMLPDIDFEGKGFATLILDDYMIKIKGKFREFISIKDRRFHLSIVNHNIDTELRGRLTFECADLLHPDKAKSDLAMSAIREHNKDIEKKILRSPFLENFMKLFVNRLDTYLTNFPLEELFTKEKKCNALNVFEIC